MKKTVAVFFGGKSPEHDISIVTALAAVIKPLELSGKYDVVPIYISKAGKWYTGDALKDIKTFQGKAVEAFLEKTKPLAIVFDDGLYLQRPGLKRERLKVDVAFPAMHGAYGEDGSLMGLLRMAGIPFVGSDMAASVIAMDKVLAKQVAAASGIPITPFVAFSRREFETDREALGKKIQDELTFPVFVKPAHLGSSIGITKVDKPADLMNAVEVAAFYDDKLIVEEAVANLIEVTVPIIGNDDPQPALVERPLQKDGEFFDFETKYMHGGGKKTGGAKSAGAQGYSELPADIPKDLYDGSLAVALQVYRATGATGISRIDLLIDGKKKQIFFNELNPLPGSLYAHNWRQAGVSSIDLVTRLVELAEERFAEQQNLEHVFSTNFLQQF